MKKTVTVVIEKEIEIAIPDELCSQEVIDEFSEFMFPIESADDLFEYVAAQIAMHGATFVEGVGLVRDLASLASGDLDEEDFGFLITADSVEAEVLPC